MTFSAVSRDKYLRILAMLRRWKLALLHTLEMCDSMLNSLSYTTPRLRALLEADRSWLLIENCCEVNFAWFVSRSQNKNLGLFRIQSQETTTHQCLNMADTFVHLLEGLICGYTRNEGYVELGIIGIQMKLDVVMSSDVA